MTFDVFWKDMLADLIDRDVVIDATRDHALINLIAHKAARIRKLDGLLRTLLAEIDSDPMAVQFFDLRLITDAKTALDELGGVSEHLTEALRQRLWAKLAALRAGADAIDNDIDDEADDAYSFTHEDGVRSACSAIEAVLDEPGDGA